jgi:hypothetical protein
MKNVTSRKQLNSGIITDVIFRKMLQAFNPTTETNALIIIRNETS